MGPVDKQPFQLLLNLEIRPSVAESGNKQKMTTTTISYIIDYSDTLYGGKHSCLSHIQSAG